MADTDYCLMMFVLVTSDDDEKAYCCLVKLWVFFEIFNCNAVSPAIDIQLQLAANLVQLIKNQTSTLVTRESQISTSLLNQVEL